MLDSEQLSHRCVGRKTTQSWHSAEAPWGSGGVPGSPLLLLPTPPPFFLSLAPHPRRQHPFPAPHRFSRSPVFGSLHVTVGGLRWGHWSRVKGTCMTGQPFMKGTGTQVVGWMTCTPYGAPLGPSSCSGQPPRQGPERPRTSVGGRLCPVPISRALPQCRCAFTVSRPLGPQPL